MFKKYYNTSLYSFNNEFDYSSVKSNSNYSSNESNNKSSNKSSNSIDKGKLMTFPLTENQLNILKNYWTINNNNFNVKRF